MKANAMRLNEGCGKRNMGTENAERAEGRTDRWHEKLRRVSSKWDKDGYGLVSPAASEIADEVAKKVPRPTIQSPYRNLKNRCERLADAIDSYVSEREGKRPDKVNQRAEYDYWVEQNDFLFHADLFKYVKQTHEELRQSHFIDPGLDRIAEKDVQDFQLRQRDVKGATAFPEMDRLSINEIKRIGNRFRALASQM